MAKSRRMCQSMFKEPILVHNFTITKNYSIFHDNQTVFRLYMWIGGSTIVYATDKVPRVAILPRYDTNDENIRWFDCSKDFGNCLHFLNAWEVGDEVVMVGSVI
ncbi:hypothetical protein L7F22_037664 [Adiantum nelumboides]|nr:hypothetical protein [Adiantum nelumboides]